MRQPKTHSTTHIFSAPTVLLVLLSTARSSPEYDYCSINCDDRTKMHTMCKYSDEISDFCVSFELQSHISESNLIDLHNSFRNEYALQHKASNMMFLIWDNELEEIATRWAEQCIDGNDECRNVARFEVSQNVGMVQFSQGQSNAVHHPTIFQKWTYEQAFCKPRSMQNWSSEFHEENCGRLTNVIWADASRFGCADAIYMVSKTTIQRILVCNYGPAGNIPGKSVFRPGKPCTGCPNGSRCYADSKYPYLCALVSVREKRKQREDYNTALRSGASKHNFLQNNSFPGLRVILYCFTALITNLSA